MLEQALGLDRFGVVFGGRGELEMRKHLLTSMGLAGLVAVSVVQEAVASPTAPVVSPIIAPHGRSHEPWPILSVPLQQSLLCTPRLPLWSLALLLRDADNHWRTARPPGQSSLFASGAPSGKGPTNHPELKEVPYGKDGLC